MSASGRSVPRPEMASDFTRATSTELQAVILAAGLGRRMGALCSHTHKALLPVAGATILGRIMAGLQEIAVSKVTVVTGYRAAEVEAFLRHDCPGFDLQLVHNPRFADTNNVVSLALALDQLTFDTDVILVECDLLFEPALLRRLLDSPGGNVALVDHYRTGMDGTVVSTRNGFISGVYPTDSQTADFSYEGKLKTLNIYRFEREFARKTLAPILRTYATEVDSSCYYELVLGMLSNVPEHRIAAEVVDGERWFEVDDQNDIAGAEFRFRPAHRGKILEGTFGGHWNFDVLDFSFMRNAYFPTGAMLAALRQALPELVACYGSSQAVLNAKLGHVLGCDPLRLQVLHGASQAFPILSRLLPAHEVLLPAPSFGEYRRVFAKADQYLDAPGIDDAELEEKAAQSALCVIVNPNSPTGTLLRSSRIVALATKLSGTRFLVDESFLAFSGEPSLVELLEAQPLDNVIVLTSLSKCLGAPGLRLGYLYSCDRTIVDAVGSMLPVWNLSAPAEFLLELLLKFRPAYAQSLVQTAVDRDTMRAQLEALPAVARVHASAGNFLLVELHGPEERAASLRAWLLEAHGIEIKDVTGRFEDSVPRVRVGVRLPEENAILIRALSELRGP